MRSFLPSSVRPLLKRAGAIAWMMMGASLAASAAEPAVPQTVIDAFSRANAAVVGVQVSATEGYGLPRHWANSASVPVW